MEETFFMVVRIVRKDLPPVLAVRFPKSILLTRRRSDSPTLYSTIKFEKGPGKDYEKDVLILPSLLGKNLHTPFGRLLGC